LNPLLSALLWPALHGAGLAASLLPRSWELRLGPWLGRFLLLLDPRRRRIACENIRLCLPELGEEARQRLLRKNYEHYGILALELLHMFSPIPGHYRAYARRIAVLEGFENWKLAHDKGRGVLFVSAHLANWEMMAAIGGLHGIPITMVTRRLKPGWLHRKIEEARASVNVRCALQPRTMPAVMKGLGNGESIGFVLDQYAAPPAGIPARFFGIMVDTLGAVGPLAQRTGAAIVPVLQRRDEKGVLRVVMEPALALGEALNDPGKVAEILLGRIEAWIRETPSQWLWVHRRFKNVSWPRKDAKSGLSGRP